MATLDGFSCPGGGGVTLQPQTTHKYNLRSQSRRADNTTHTKCLDSNLWTLHPLPHCSGVPVLERYTFIQWHRLNTYVHTYVLQPTVTLKRLLH